MPKPAIHITLEPDIIAMIDKECGGPVHNSGTKSGRSQWVRQLIYKKLGIEKSNYHEQKHNQMFKELIGTECNVMLSIVDSRILNLFKQNKSLNRIAHTLNQEGYVTKRNKKWKRETVRRCLKRISKQLSSCSKAGSQCSYMEDL